MDILSLVIGAAGMFLLICGVDAAVVNRKNRQVRRINERRGKGE